MPKRTHHPLKRPMTLERRFINRIIIVVAALQPLGTIPQIIAVYSHRDASSISISSWLIYIVFDMLWLWYGISERQKAVIVSAVLFTIVEGLVAIGGFMYGGRW